MDLNKMLEELRELDEKKKIKVEADKVKREVEIEYDLNLAYSRLNEMLHKDDKLHQLVMVFDLLNKTRANRYRDENGNPTPFCTIQTSNSAIDEGKLKFFIYDEIEKIPSIKLMLRDDITYISGNALFKNRAEVVMKLKYDTKGDYKVIFNCQYKRVDKDWTSWYPLGDDEQAKKIKTRMINSFCNELPEFMLKSEHIFTEFRNEQKELYGNIDLSQKDNVVDKQLALLENEFDKYTVYCRTGNDKSYLLDEDGETLYCVDSTLGMDETVILINHAKEHNIDSDTGRLAYIFCTDTENRDRLEELWEVYKDEPDFYFDISAEFEDGFEQYCDEVGLEL